MLCNPQVPLTEDQWVRVNQAVLEEAQRARVAATFLPLYGPLPADTDFVRKVDVSEAGPLEAKDKQIIELSTLQVKVKLRGAQLADPELGSVLSVFRRAGNILARVEDALVFDGQDGAAPIAAAHGVEIADDQGAPGLITDAVAGTPPVTDGDSLVAAVANAIGYLETNGHFGPFAVVLSQPLFLISLQPDPDRPQVTPQQQIIPLLGGGLRCFACLGDRQWARHRRGDISWWRPHRSSRRHGYVGSVPATDDRPDVHFPCLREARAAHQKRESRA